MGLEDLTALLDLNILGDSAFNKDMLLSMYCAISGALLTPTADWTINKTNSLNLMDGACSTSTSGAVENIPKFHVSSKLPLEMRPKIWSFALPEPQLLGVSWTGPCKRSEL